MLQLVQSVCWCSFR